MAPPPLNAPPPAPAILGTTLFSELERQVIGRLLNAAQTGEAPKVSKPDVKGTMETILKETNLKTTAKPEDKKDEAEEEKEEEAGDGARKSTRARVCRPDWPSGKNCPPGWPTSWSATASCRPDCKNAPCPTM